MGFLSSKSVVENDINNEVHNQHATAGADGFAVGAGSNVSIENVSDDIAIEALSANRDAVQDALDSNSIVSRASLDLAEDVNSRLSDFGSRALDTVSGELGRSNNNIISFAAQTLSNNKDLVEKQLDANNAFARDQSELIAAQAGVVAPTDNKRQQLIVGGALLLVALFALPKIFKSSN